MALFISSSGGVLARHVEMISPIAKKSHQQGNRRR